MVDAERPVLGEGSGNGVVDLAAGFEIGTEGFLEGHADRRAGQARSLKPVDRRLEQRWRGRQEDRDAVAWVANRLSQALKPGRIVDVERHVMEAREEAVRDALLIE